MKYLMSRNDFHAEKELDELKHRFFVELYHDGVTWNLKLTDHDDKSIVVNSSGDDLFEVFKTAYWNISVM